MEEVEQETMEFMCPLEKEFTIFITKVNNPETVVCTTCPYTMKRKNGVTREKIKKEKLNNTNKDNMKNYYDHLLSLQTQN